MDENMGLIHLGTWGLENCVPKQKILAKVLVFMGGFVVWAQVCGVGSCVGKTGARDLLCRAQTVIIDFLQLWLKISRRLVFLTSLPVISPIIKNF